MMVTFRCKRSGNTVSFINEGDIAGLRAHEGYEEVKDESTNENAEENAPEENAEKVLKRPYIRRKK